jgi:hypothetical protein
MTTEIRPVHTLTCKGRGDYYTFSPGGPAKTVCVEHHAEDGAVIDNDVVDVETARAQWKQLEASGFLCTDPKYRPKEKRL